MGVRAAASLLKGAGRASGRFLAEVAVSFVATLCVTLVLSGWFRPGTPSVPSPRADAPSTPAPVIVANPPADNFTRESVSNSDARAAVFDASSPRAVSPRAVLADQDATEKERPAAIRMIETASAVTATPQRNRPSHVGKAAPHVTQASGHLAGEAAAKTANLEPLSHQAGSDPQAVSIPALATEDDHRATVFGIALPSIPMHGVFVHPLRPVIAGASSVTELVTGLAGSR
ncbi:MAG: hypothetical protein JO188_20910 [Hyphomicrobiales bacterium]|nr:hypothetical protein [Hyphomicrobiales bacterium]